MVAVPPRLAWAVATMGIAPDQRVLEIGCGSGTAAALVLRQLSTGTGHLTGLDRSRTAVAAAESRNAESVRAGRAGFLATALDRADLPERGFDTVFAINVNLFWVHDAVLELDVVRRSMRPGGGLYLFNEPPDPRRAVTVGERVSAFLTEQGMVTEIRRADTRPDRTMVCVLAREPVPVRRTGRSGTARSRA